MSWDFWMEADVGGKEPVDIGFDANYTYNVSPMFYDAFNLEEGIRGLDKMLGDEAMPYLENAIIKMKENPKKYKAMNPSNGWGDYDTALELLEKLLGWCIEAPKAQMRVG